MYKELKGRFIGVSNILHMEFLKKHVVLKVLLALLPAVIFTQNYAWMTQNAYLGFAFLLLWILMIWSLSQLVEKNYILERTFRLTEIAFFLLPISAIVLTVMFGAQSISQGNGAEAAGAAIGTAIGGTFLIGISFVVGLIGGLILHLLAGKYEKRAQESGVDQPESIANKHGLVLSVLAVFVIAFVLGVISASINTDKNGIPTEVQGNTQKQTEKALSEQDQTAKVSAELLDKGFYQADPMDGEYQDQITLEVQFRNKTDKEIRGVEGVMTFYDMFDKEIMSSRVSFEEGIPANGTNTWDAVIDYNQFLDDHQQLKNTTFENLQVEWEADTIVYENGTKESF